jgi:transposase
LDPQLLLPPGAGLVVEQVRLWDEIVHLTVRREAAGVTCPDCGAWSEAFHSDYERNLGDLPIAGRQAVIDLQVRRFRCYQPACPRKTFVEQAPVLAEQYAHRTLRLRSLLEDIGLALGVRPGSRHCRRSAIPTSRTTLLRMVRALPEQPIAAPRVLGVDEFAFRKGRRYGTILVAADAHRIVDLLEDPSADALVDWLTNHPGAELICRDRDGVYASAARRGAPDALQVADRWHWCTTWPTRWNASPCGTGSASKATESGGTRRRCRAAGTTTTGRAGSADSEKRATACRDPRVDCPRAHRQRHRPSRQVGPQDGPSLRQR